MIYLDNGATSFPKPPAVYDGVNYYIRYCGASAGRSAHKKAREAMEIALECRIALADFINADNPESIVFTKNATEGLNIMIRGMVKDGDKVIVSPLEHNSVMRPLYASNAEISVLPLNEDGTSDMDALKNMLNGTKFVIINHVSNVSGAINDVYKAGNICAEAGIPLLIDCSQSMGHFEVNVKKLKASVAFPGHKGLLGPQGTGGMYLHNILPQALCFGGTGSDSESMIQPTTMPDYYESGTINLVGIAGLSKGIAFINSEGQQNIMEKEYELTSILREGLGNMNGVHLLCPLLKDYGEAVSFTADSIDPSEIALILDEKYDIAVRSGLHCAPAAHNAYGTIKSGTVRLTPGYFNTKKEMKIALNAINNIVNHRT
ncbi:MAG: aminotransferase class V-fold PLP-dependent enzyme [Bacillota bacterium]|nr:aminotransferase class V-fold PLP-dependent enzyme [Bacillota bacterium]